MLVQDIFESRYIPEPNSGCWLWLDAIGEKNKYGQFRLTPNLTILPHRFSWMLYNMGKLPDEMFVLHKCDVPSCVNPDHLFLGTLADNVADMDAKGRRSAPPDNRGQRHGHAKLSDCDIPEIRRAHAAGAKQQSLADQYGVSIMTVNRVVNRKLWKHLP